MLILLYLIYIIAVAYWQIKIVKAGQCSKGKAIILFATYSIMPVILYGTVFIILTGVEELTDIAVIGEGYARTLLLVLAGGIAVTLFATLIFSLAILTVKQSDTHVT